MEYLTLKEIREEAAKRFYQESRQNDFINSYLGMVDKKNNARVRKNLNRYGKKRRGK